MPGTLRYGALAAAALLFIQRPPLSAQVKTAVEVPVLGGSSAVGQSGAGLGTAPAGSLPGLAPSLSLGSPLSGTNTPGPSPTVVPVIRTEADMTLPARPLTAAGAAPKAVTASPARTATRSKALPSSRLDPAAASAGTTARGDDGSPREDGLDTPAGAGRFFDGAVARKVLAVAAERESSAASPRRPAPLKKPQQAPDPGKKYVSANHQTFTRARGLAEYVHAFDGGAKGDGHTTGPFSRKMEALRGKAGARWLDSGAGEGLATAQKSAEPGYEGLTTTLVSFQTSAEPGPRRRILSGRFLQDIPQEELGKNDLITDVIGILAYTFNFMGDLRKLVDSLTPEGELFVFLGTSKNDFWGKDNTVLAHGVVWTLGDYLKTIPGLGVEMVKTPLYDNIDGSLMGEVWNARIRRIPGVEPRWPELETVYYRDGDRSIGEMVPERIFALKGDPGLAPAEISRQAAAAQAAFAAGSTPGSEAFFDKFRGVMPFSNPLMSRLARLSAARPWALLGPKARRVADDLRAGAVRFTDPSFSRPTQWAMEVLARLLRKGPAVAVSDASGLAPGFRADVLVVDDGNASYRLDQDLERWIAAVPDGGEVWLSLGPEAGGTGTGIRILTRDGRRRDVRDWLGTIPGLKTKWFRGHRLPPSGRHEEPVFLRITVPDHAKVRIPGLTLLGVGAKSAEGVPVPLYRETAPRPSR